MPDFKQWRTNFTILRVHFWQVFYFVRQGCCYLKNYVDALVKCEHVSGQKYTITSTNLASIADLEQNFARSLSLLFKDKETYFILKPFHCFNQTTKLKKTEHK